jgi:hypothetical protein
VEVKLNTELNIPDALIEALMVETGEKDKNRLIILALEWMLKTLELRKPLAAYNSSVIEMTDLLNKIQGELSDEKFPNPVKADKNKGDAVTWEKMYGIGKGLWNIDAQKYVNRLRKERI